MVKLSIARASVIAASFQSCPCDTGKVMRVIRESDGHMPVKLGALSLGASAHRHDGVAYFVQPGAQPLHLPAKLGDGGGVPSAWAA